jgi:chorismate mutase
MKLLIRLQKKVETYSPDIAADSDPTPKTNGTNGLRKLNHGKIDIDGVVDLYESYIIPLTKEVEVNTPFNSSVGCISDCPTKVDYLLHRLDGLDEETIEMLRKKDF